MRLNRTNPVPALATSILRRIGLPGCARINATVSVDNLYPTRFVPGIGQRARFRRAAYDEVAKPFFILRRLLHFVGSEVLPVRRVIAQALNQWRAQARLRARRILSKSWVRALFTRSTASLSVMLSASASRAEKVTAVLRKVCALGNAGAFYGAPRCRYNKRLS